MSHFCFKPSLISLAIFASGLHAQESSIEAIERIDVWSTQINASSEYLDQDHIEARQANHISDLLRSIPGVDVGGAHSLNQRITIRSMDDKDLKISIDGAQQNTYMYHHMGNLQIHADILQSVNLEIGTNSVVNGGLGGAVRFETKNARDLLTDGKSFGGRLHLGYGDNSGTNLSFTGFGQLTESLDVLGYINRVNNDNYEVGGGKILDADGNVFPGTDGKVRGLKGKVTDALVKFGYDIDANQRIKIGYEKYKDKGDYSFRPDMGLATDLAITNFLGLPLLWPTEFGRDTLTFSYQGNWGEDSELRINAYRNTSELKRDERGWAANPRFARRAGHVTGEAKNTGLNLIAETRIEGEVSHTLTYGADYVKHDTYYNSLGLTGTNTNSAEEAGSLAAFLQDRIGLNQHWAIIAGVRAERYSIDSKVTDDSFSDLNFALAIEFQPKDNLLLKLSTTQLFKGPEIGEVFVGAGLFDRANPDIESETGLNTELAMAYQEELTQDIELNLGATLFYTQINDYIYDYAQIPGGGRRDQWKDNVGDLNIRGIEAFIGLKSAQWQTQLSYSDASSELDAFANYATLDNARIDREQGDTFNLRFTYELANTDARLQWEITRVNSLPAGLDLYGATLLNAKDGFIVHNISARWQPESVQGLSFTLGVDNLFDEFYASQSSRTGTSFHPLFKKLYLLDYEPGRNIKASVSYQF